MELQHSQDYSTRQWAPLQSVHAGYPMHAAGGDGYCRSIYGECNRFSVHPCGE